ncbi:MAG TPA: lipid IV(A) 3-deoxy-D-manno-octulosonic acid transferase [Steroidobacteraceae bacterium]|nr:lipid IV(A) 3-deoxy-D-manno-octulosonic acid transferase [Steroidobacteraceae bacterium]
MRYLYSALVYLFRPIAFAVVLWRGLSNRLYWVGLRERFGFGPGCGSPTIWVHAVSLGEVNAAAPLIRTLQARYPHIPVLLTTATPTGRAKAHALFGGSIAVRFLPYDTPGAMRRFVTRVRPCLAIIMETELWPNLFNECRRGGIPVVLASARLSLKSVARYRRFGGLFRGVFSGNTLVAAQTAEDAERFMAIGADRSRTRVIGNVKFDMAIDAAQIARGFELRSAYWGARPVWIAGSTHAGEEEPVLAAHAELQADAAGALLLLVPRHPERFQAVADLLGRRGVRFERRSSGNAVRPDCQVLLVDTVGELAELYAAVDVAFVGGSLVPVGGHNLLEPAALGVPVIMGPYQSSGKEIAQLLLQQGAALQVADAEQLAAVLKQLFADPARRQRVGSRGRHVVDVNRGSVARLLDLIEPILGAKPIL